MSPWKPSWRHADGRVRRIVLRKVVQRRNPRIRLAVVIAIEAFVVSAESRPAVRRHPRPVVKQAPVQRHFDRVIRVHRIGKAHVGKRGECGDGRRVDRRGARRVRQDVRHVAADIRGLRRNKGSDRGTVGHVFEHAPDIAVDVADAEARVRHDFTLDTEDVLVDVGHLRVGIDRVARGGAVGDEVCRRSRRRTGHDAVAGSAWSGRRRSSRPG